jgi:pimeloyl-ACP methyl ester carboxylesterase
MNMPKTKVNDIQLYYEVHGEGIPLVLISGLGYPLWQWHLMVPHLEKHFQVITLDNRGVGQSDKPAGPYTASVLARDIVELLDSLGIDEAVVMGHSMGGFIAQALALEYPARVSKLILASTNFGGPRHVPVTPEAMAVLSDTTTDPLTRLRNGIVISTAPGFAERQPELIQKWLDWRVANPLDIPGYQAQMGIGVALLAEGAAFENKLTDVSAPTLILFGAHDKVVPPANADLLAKQIPGSQIRILPDAGHFFPLEVPEEAAQIVIQFAKQEV